MEKPGRRVLKASGKWIIAVSLWALAAFPLHLLWEAMQLPFYTLWTAYDAETRLRYLVHCSLGDALIAAGTFLFAAVITGRISWLEGATIRGGILVALSGLAYTVLSEWYNVYQAGAWAYGANMPLVGGIGLTPLLQWLYCSQCDGRGWPLGLYAASASQEVE